LPRYSLISLHKTVGGNPHPPDILDYQEVANAFIRKICIIYPSKILNLSLALFRNYGVLKWRCQIMTQSAAAGQVISCLKVLMKTRSLGLTVLLKYILFGPAHPF
jgi:hypothetical protein